MRHYLLKNYLFSIELSYLHWIVILFKVSWLYLCEPVSEFSVLCCWFFFFNTKNVLYLGIADYYNVVIVSGEQWRDSAIYIQVSILPQIHLLPRLAHNIEQSSMCYTICFCWLLLLLSHFSCVWLCATP